jgi:hypothetical protein
VVLQAEQIMAAAAEQVVFFMKAETLQQELLVQLQLGQVERQHRHKQKD